ncbi:MAG: Gfo/Idh/MocA family oxidoreductase [Bacteroidia bacterium]|nr:Gfo/Idh/MocA family oxidoreductase [Bacteroidia bacterium]
MRRRQFIKQSVIIGAASAYPFICKSAIPKKKLGVALVGLGSYSTGQLAPALQKTRFCELVGIVTGSPEKIPRWQRQYKIKDANVYNYENMHRIADNKNIDVIYIVVPTGLHMKYSVIAANAGKHVWCEKPMAMTEEECQTIIDTCNANKVKLSIGYRMQHEKNTKRIIEFTKNQSFGKIESVIAEAGYRGGGGTGWRFQKAMGGGAMYDMGVYTVNGARYATQMEPLEISAQHILNRPELFKEVDETTKFTMRFPDGVEALCRTSVGESFNQLKVNASVGWYELSPMQSYDGVAGSTSDGRILSAMEEDQQVVQMDDNARAILKDMDVLVPGEEGLKDIRIVEAAFQSAANNGEWIRLQ